MFNLFFLQSFPFLIFLKIALLIFDLFFIVFLLIVLKQVMSMNSIVNEVHDAFVLKTLSVISVIFGLSLFLTALVIL